jgi:hypothetical protein
MTKHTSTCTKCPANMNTQVGIIGSKDLTHCVCNSGFTGPNGGTCTACVAGKYKPFTGTAACTDCVISKYSSSDAAAFCSFCPTNSSEIFLLQTSGKKSTLACKQSGSLALQNGRMLKELLLNRCQCPFAMELLLVLAMLSIENFLEVTVYQSHLD